MKGKIPFARPQRLENVYRLQIDRLIDEYFAFPTFSTLGEINARLVELAQAKSFFQSVAKQLALKMVTQVAVNNAHSWRAAARKASKGRFIHSMLQDNIQGSIRLNLDALIHTNSRLITSLPERIASTVSKHVQTLQMQGLRSEEIVKHIRQYMPKAKHYQVERLARTEVAKADTAITRARAQNIGLNWYQWVTSEDARVRPSHRKMDLALINWNDAPSPELLVGEASEGHYHAGNVYNCRCVALPLISLSEISFPVRVYTGNSLKRLTKNQFALISGNRSLAA